MSTNQNVSSTPASLDGKTRGCPLKIGEILINEGFVKQEDVQKALDIQKQENQLKRLPLGQILVRTGRLSESDLEGLLNHPDLRRALGPLAVEKGIINKEQLASCLKKKAPHELIGQVLVKEGLLTSEQVGSLLKTQVNSRRLGELAVQLRLITSKDLEQALRMQKSPRPLGQILCDLGLMNSLDLNHVLAKHNKQLELGDVLLTLGYIDKEQLTAARAEQFRTGESLDAILLRNKGITAPQRLLALSRQYNIPFETLSDFTYSEFEKKDLSKIVSRKYAEKHQVIPVSLKDDKLSLAIFRPEDMDAIYELKRMYSHFRVICLLITHDKFEQLFHLLYSTRPIDASEAKSDAAQEGVDFMALDFDEEIKEELGRKVDYGVQDLEAEELVNFIIRHGVISGASDIHIEQDRAGSRLRYRMDGVLRECEIGWLNQKLQERVAAVISRIKVMSNLDIAEKRMPQDGVFRITYFDKAENRKFQLDFRVATCCGISGENVTVRILDSRKADVDLESLNHSPHVLEPLKTLVKSPSGMILVCGPTGSGKSTTLRGALRYIYDPSIKIITAEDPIEYSFPGIMQTQVHPKINLDFARLLRSFLRLDPDVILVGEIRDNETAKIAFDACQTGHLLLSTLHTNDSVSAISRLLDLDVEYGQMASSLLCVLAQRMVRTICKDCITEHIPGEDEWSLVFQDYPSHLTFHKGEGCQACNFTGFKGRTVLSEILVLDVELAKALSKGLDESEIRKRTTESGMTTMLDDGLLRLNEISLSEIIRMIPHDMLKAHQARTQAQNMADLFIQGLLDKKDAKQEEETSTRVFHLSNPETEKAIIDSMQATYEQLKALNGATHKAVDTSVFQEFITENFTEICIQHGCNGVTFSIENVDERTEISAVPSYISA